MSENDIDYGCQNCGFEAHHDKFNDAQDLYGRITDGFPMSTRECPKCGALAYPLDSPAFAESPPPPEVWIMLTEHDGGAETFAYADRKDAEVKFAKYLSAALAKHGDDWTVSFEDAPAVSLGAMLDLAVKDGRCEIHPEDQTRPWISDLWREACSNDMELSDGLLFNQGVTDLLKLELLTVEGAPEQADTNTLLLAAAAVVLHGKLGNKLCAEDSYYEDLERAVELAQGAPHEHDAAQLLVQVFEILDADEWSSDTAPAIATVLGDAGFVIAEPDEAKGKIPARFLATPSATAQKAVCTVCGSENVLADAYADWNTELQRWEVANVFDKGHRCNACDGECKIDMVPVKAESSPKPG